MESENEYKHLTPYFHLCLVKKMLYMLTDLLDNNKVKYFMDGGTLLGAIREKEIIAHDDDADIGVFYNDFQNKLPGILNEIEKYSIKVGEEIYNIKTEKTNKNLMKVYVPGLWSKTEFGKVIGTPTIDIFCYNMKHNIIQLECPKQRQLFPNCCYKRTEMFPLTRWKFGEKELYGAKNPLGYLFRYYGKDCLTTVKIDIRQTDDGHNKERNVILNN